MVWGILKLKLLPSTWGLGEIMSFKGDNINGEILGSNGYGCEREKCDCSEIATFEDWR